MESEAPIDRGQAADAANVRQDMAANLDPKPGRWVLPLVVLAMIAFTYFFVSELPEAPPNTTLAGPATTTTAPPGDTTLGDADGGVAPIDEATRTYLDGIVAVNDKLKLGNTEMVAVNTGFDASPKEIEYSDAGSRIEKVKTDTEALSEELAALTAPAGLETNHETLKAKMGAAATAADEALSGLRSDDPGDARREAVESYTTAATEFAAEVDKTREAAGDS